MALYKQGSQREEDHKARGPKSRGSGRSHDGSARAANGTGSGGRGLAGGVRDRAKRCFFFIVTIKIGVGWARDHTALVTEKVIDVTAFCKPT